MVKGYHGRSKKAESKKTGRRQKNLKRLGWEDENPQSVVVPNDDDDDDALYGFKFCKLTKGQSWECIVRGSDNLLRG